MIIGFVGKKQSGKSTACSIVEGDLPDVVRINMKDALIEEIVKNFPRTMKEILNSEPENATQCKTIEDLFMYKPNLVRTFMQEYGTEVRRGDSPSYWTDQWKIKVEKALAEGKHVVVDDVRFLNEAEAVKKMGGVIVRISRTDLKDTDTHASEMEMDQIVPNYKFEVGPGELDLLTLKVRSIYKHLAE